MPPTSLPLEKMADIEVPVFLETKEKGLSVATMGDVVAGTWFPGTLFPWHRIEILILIFFD